MPTQVAESQIQGNTPCHEDAWITILFHAKFSSTAFLLASLGTVQSLLGQIQPCDKDLYALSLTTGSTPWRSLKHWWLHHILSTNPGKRWSQVKLNQRSSMDNNHWVWRLYDLDQTFGDFPFCLLPFTVLLRDYLRTWRMYEGCNFRNIQDLPTVHPVQAAFISQLDYWVTYLLVLLYLLLPLPLHSGLDNVASTSNFSGGPIASASGSAIRKQTSAVSYSGVVQVMLFHGHLHCR